MSPALRFVGGVGAVVLVAVIGWLGFSAMQHRPAPSTEPAAATTTTTAPAETAAEASERERLQRERDDALAAARTAEQALAQERTRRQAAERASAQTAPSALGRWHGYVQNNSSGQDHHFVLTSDGHFARNGATWDSGSGSWTQSGDHVVLTYGDGWREDLRISGTRMTGQSLGADGAAEGATVLSRE